MDNRNTLIVDTSNAKLDKAIASDNAAIAEHERVNAAFYAALERESAK